MALTLPAARDLLFSWTPTESLRRHARSVELVMSAFAARAGLDEPEVEAYAITGLLHDADYDQWPTEHPQRIVAWLREHGEPVIAHAISAHYTKWNVPHESQLDKALLACDELTGFIGACCHVREGGIHTLEPASVTKKLKDKLFAAKVERDEIHAGIGLLNVDLPAHIAFIIEALRPHADELGLRGRAASKPA